MTNPAHAGSGSTGDGVTVPAATDTATQRPLRRLTGHGAFDAVLRAGRRMEGHYLQLIAAPAPEEGGRSGFIIGRKVSPRAVDRNRIRRKLREILRSLPATADRYDLVLRVKRGRTRHEQDAATDEARRLLALLVAAAAGDAWKGRR